MGVEKVDMTASFNPRWQCPLGEKEEGIEGVCRLHMNARHQSVTAAAAENQLLATDRREREVHLSTEEGGLDNRSGLSPSEMN